MNVKSFFKPVGLCILGLAMSVVLTAQAAVNLASTEERTAPELLPALRSSAPFDFAATGTASYVERFNALAKSAALPKDDAVKVRNEYIPGADGQKEIRLRIYEPVERKGNLPAVYWIHGGGFLFGIPEQDEAQSLRLAKEVGAVVVAVDYRLAPAHPYPAPLEDSYAGLVWLAANADKLGVDKSRIAVAGASAGGNLCAAVALMARDKGGPELALQMPLYPMLDDRFITPSAREEIDSRVWNNTANAYAWQAYLGDVTGTDKVTAYMAPARAENLQGLPPTYTCVGNLDPFRDDTINYVARLIQAGVPAELHIYPGAYHAFEVIAPQAEMSRRAADEYVYVLRRALHKVN